MKLRTIIADDEPLSLSRLRRLLGKESEIELVAEAQNGDELLRLIEHHLPDLVVTDIQMPSKTGLEAALEMCERWDTPPAFIFCTAYPDFAIEAYKALAVGYIVKPIEQAKLGEAIQRVGKLNQTQQNQIDAQGGDHPRLLVQAAGQLESYAFDDIDYFSAADKSVFAYIGDRPVAIDKSLQQLEVEFEGHILRIHRSTLVNVKRIVRIYSADKGGSKLETSGGHHLSISRRLLAEAKRVFKTSLST